jgi:hypothetical protein
VVVRPEGPGRHEPYPYWKWLSPAANTARKCRVPAVVSEGRPLPHRGSAPNTKRHGTPDTRGYGPHIRDDVGDYGLTTARTAPALCEPPGGSEPGLSSEPVFR